MTTFIAGVLTFIAGLWLFRGTGSLLGPLYLLGVAAVLLLSNLWRHL